METRHSSSFRYDFQRWCWTNRKVRVVRQGSIWGYISLRSIVYFVFGVAHRPYVARVAHGTRTVPQRKRPHTRHASRAPGRVRRQGAERSRLHGHMYSDSLGAAAGFAPERTTVLIKVKIKKKKPTQLSTLNHSHAVAAPHVPQRDSSTHHTPLHHTKVHPPHAAGWRTKSKMTQ